MVTNNPITTIVDDDESGIAIHLPLLLEPETSVEAEKKIEKPRRVTHVRQLFVGNLPFRVRWQDVKDLFRKAGNVQRADVALSFDNRSKGHGTVLFNSVEDAQRAVDMLHNYKWQGRVLEVREDRGFVEPSQQMMPQLRQLQLEQKRMVEHMISAEVPGGKQLFVGNLSFHCQWQDVKDLFRNAGNILRADVVQGPDGRSRGFGTVLFATHEDAKNAIVMYDGFEFHGRQLRVHFDKFAPGPPPHQAPQPPLLPQPQPFTLMSTYRAQHNNFTYPLPYPYPSPLAPHSAPSNARLPQHLLATDNRPRLLQHPPLYNTHYRQPYLPQPFEESNPLGGSIGISELAHSSPAEEIRPIFMHPWQQHNKDEAFFSPPPQRSPSLPISPDEDLADAVKALSLTDGSAGLTTTNSDVTTQANLLTSNSVWEPLSGFKY